MPGPSPKEKHTFMNNPPISITPKLLGKPQKRTSAKSIKNLAKSIKNQNMQRTQQT